MTKITYDIWEPVVAPWAGKADTVQAFMAFMLIAFVFAALYAVAFRLDAIVSKEAKKPWMNFVASLLAVVLVVDAVICVLFSIDVCEHTAYIKDYGECEQMYLEEVVPALERLNDGDTEIGDFAIFGEYIGKVYSEHEVPETRFKNFVDFWVQNDAGDKLIDLCDYNKLANAFNIRDLLKAIGNIDSIQFGEHP